MPLTENSQHTLIPIYDQTVWQSLMVGDEEMLVYFDSSNRAKHLVQQFCGVLDNGKAFYVGLRFILYYQGDSQDIMLLLDELQALYPV